MQSTSTYIVALLAFLCSTQVFAQDIVKDWAAMRQAYLNTPHLQANINMRAQEADGQWLDLGQGQLQLHGKNYHSVGLGKEMVLGEQGSLVLDHDTREMHYLPEPIEETPDALATMDFEALLANYDSVNFLGQKAGRKGYRIFHSNAAIESFDLWMDAEEFWLLGITYNYRSEMVKRGLPYQKVVISYEVDSSTPPPAQDFSVNKYLRSTAEGYQPTDRYQGYTLQLAATNND